MCGNATRTASTTSNNPTPSRLVTGAGLFTTDEQGRFWFRTVKPSHYPIPTDGPVGTLLKATDRHPYRPAHVHFIANADRVPTADDAHLPTRSPYLDSDAVFAVKHSLIGELGTVDADRRSRFGVTVGSAMATVDLVLAPDQDGATMSTDPFTYAALPMRVVFGQRAPSASRTGAAAGDRAGSGHLHSRPGSVGAPGRTRRWALPSSM